MIRAVPLLVREQTLAVVGLETIAKQLPFPMLCIDPDNDSVFINDTLTQYCIDHGIEFTRSQAFHKNDQAWVEQKNGASIWRFLGHERYSGQIIAHLHGALRLYVNYFQSPFELVGKPRNGSAVIKRYISPATPCDRVIQHGGSAPIRRQSSASNGPHWTRWRCCTPSGKPSQRWRPSYPRRSGPPWGVRAWNGFWPGCPTDGVRSSSRPIGSPESNRRAPGERVRIRFEGCGATCWAGCRKTRTPAAEAGYRQIPRPVQPNPPAHIAAQGATVARHHGKQDG